MSKKKQYPAGEIICKTLGKLGIEVIFGLPGTSNVELYHSLKHSSIRTITPTNELAASFMANGYYRSSGKVAALTTIPGPGFTYAISGIAEAYLDSVPILWIVSSSEKVPGKKYQHQTIDQKTLIAPIVKALFKIKSASEIQHVITEAYTTAANEEPGPVYVEIGSSVFKEFCDFEDNISDQSEQGEKNSDIKTSEQAINEILKSKHVLFYVGQGANHISSELKELVEKLNSPVLTTTSGRGVLPEDHPLSFPYSVVVMGGGKTMMDLINASEMIVALGCKFSFNGSGAFHYEFPMEKLIQIDQSLDVLNGNYKAKYQVHGDTKSFVEKLQTRVNNVEKPELKWTNEEIAEWQKKANEEVSRGQYDELDFKGIDKSKPASFFKMIQEILPEDSIFITDSGQHQLMARKYLRIKKARGLIVPSNFQSMGFAIPAAIGAKLACPSSTIVVIIGDGGFNISAMELLTCVKEKVDIKIIILNDNSFGLIKTNQVTKYGFSASTDLVNPDYASLAKSFNVNFVRLSANYKDEFTRSLRSPETTIFEILLKDSFEFQKKRSRRIIRRFVKKLLKRK